MTLAAMRASITKKYAPLLFIPDNYPAYYLKFSLLLLLAKTKGWQTATIKNSFLPSFCYYG